MDKKAAVVMYAKKKPIPFAIEEVALHFRFNGGKFLSKPRRSFGGMLIWPGKDFTMIYYPDFRMLAFSSKKYAKRKAEGKARSARNQY